MYGLWQYGMVLNYLKNLKPGTRNLTPRNLEFSGYRDAA
jgi:hypothetical protein